MTTIVTKNNSTASAVPSASVLVQGELAVNVTDKRLFTENNSGVVVELGTNPTSLTTGSITVTGTVDGRDVAADGTKLDGIEASADVTDVINVTAAGALMDTEVTNLAQVKAFDSANYATAAQGAIASAALSKAGGAMTGPITTNSTFDGVDIAVRNGVLSATTTTANAALPKTGGAMTGAITTNSTIAGRNVAADGTKLDGIASGATGNQTAAQLLTSIKTVDGSGCGLDADKVDGFNISTASTGTDANTIYFRTI
tara:strand:- start:426 stop:1196 length:771 start_codon:yes stop_codon:yes gene_type:complete